MKIPPVPMNINHLEKIPSNSKLNGGNFIMLLLNIMLEKLTYNVGYILHLHTRHHNSRVLAEMLAILPLNALFVNFCFPCENITLNVLYYVNLYLFQ